MRTTIDIPDHLMKRVKRVAAQRKTTLRGLMLDALERSLSAKPEPFELRDASVGPETQSVGSASINRAIDELREGIHTS
jgi:hypothetical protein